MRISPRVDLGIFQWVDLGISIWVDFFMIYIFLINESTVY